LKENSGVVGGGELAVVRGAQRYHNVSSIPHFVDFFFIFSKLERFFIRANQNTCVSLFVFSQTYKRVVGFSGDPSAVLLGNTLFDVAVGLTSAVPT